MKKGSVILTTAAVIIAMLLLLAMSISAPWLATAYANLRALSDVSRKALLGAFYFCTAPSAVSLVCLLILLSNISRDQPFLKKNSMYMSIISWCCAAVAVICTFFGVYYMPLWFITFTMAFLFLIVRVVRKCFIAATDIKEENSLTI